MIDPKSGALIDPETGEVLEESLPDLGPEWRGSLEGERSRAGAPTTRRLHDYGVLSYIWSDRWDGRGRLIENRAGVERLRKLHARLRQDRRYRKLVSLLSMVNRLCRVHNLPDRVCEEACFYARKLFAVYRGYRPSERLLERIAAAAVYVAAHVHGVGVLGLKVDMSYVWRLYQVVGLRSCTVKKRIYFYMNRCAKYVVRDHKLCERVVTLAWRIYAKYGLHVSASPQALAAATVYVAAKLLDIPATQAELADAVGITDATLRTALKKMGLKILYKCNEQLEEWRYGKDCHGVRTPSTICHAYALDCRPKIELKDNNTIEVELCG